MALITGKGAASRPELTAQRRPEAAPFERMSPHGREDQVHGYQPSAAEARMAYYFHMSAHGCEQHPHCPVRQALYEAWARPEHMTDEDRRLVSEHHFNFNDNPEIASGAADRALDERAERAVRENPAATAAVFKL